MRLLPLLSLSAVVAGVAACASSAHRAEPKTFPEQVARGQELFAANCAKCHGEAGEGGKGPRLVGLQQGALPLDPPASRKHRHTRFVTVGDVADFVMANMPADNPGSLTGPQYLAILAFDLKANGIDLGSEPLTMAKARELQIPR